VQECDSVLEFLSDPLVLVQILHYPSVLHHWLMAAAAEVLRFEQQISEFVFIPYPEAMNSIMILLSAYMHTLGASIKRLFQYLEALVVDNLDRRNIIYSSSFKIKGLEVFLSALQNFRSEKGQNVIKFFKRLSWQYTQEEKNNKSFKRPRMRHTKCRFQYYKKYFQNINSASGFTGNLLISAMDIQACELQYCQCEECLKMYGKIRKERRDFFKTVSATKDMITIQIKMIQFFDKNLKERLPGVKDKGFSAHLVNKEMLYLQWKYEALEGIMQKIPNILPTYSHHIILCAFAFRF
jgi:hypothetical protein